MRPISPKNKEIINSDPYYKKCIRENEGTCRGKITIDHAYIYAGRQIDELFNFIPLCTFHHAVNEYQDSGDYDKHKSQREAMLRMTNEDFIKYSKKDWNKEKIWLKLT